MSMTPQEAIKLLDHILITKPHHITPDYEEAIKLGIEALNTVKEIDSILGEFSDSEDYDLVSDYWKRRLFSFRRDRGIGKEVK